MRPKFDRSKIEGRPLYIRDLLKFRDTSLLSPIDFGYSESFLMLGNVALTCTNNKSKSFFDFS